VNKIKELLEAHLFTVLFSMYPSLALLATNIREVDQIDVLRPLALSVSGAVILNILLAWLIKDRVRAPLITAVVLIFFFTYGHAARFLVDSVDAGFKKLIPTIFFISSIAVVFIISYFIKTTQWDLGNLLKTLNLVAVFLIFFPVASISIAAIGSNNKIAAQYELPRNSSNEALTGPQTPDQYRDIYYIILDGYSRADTLEALGFDNSEFLNELSSMGFYVASCSTSNYRATVLSMPSALNMDYLWNAVPNEGDKDTDPSRLYDSIIHNRVRNELEQRGYKTISFQTGYQWDEWTDVDLYITPTNKSNENNIEFLSVNPFEYIYLRNTALYSLIESSQFAANRYYDHYNRVIFTLDEIPNIALMPGPKFVYAHIMSPHHPFIFLPDGSLNDDRKFYDAEKGYPSDLDLFNTGYLNNIQFLNSRIPSMIQEIINNNETTPIIILQSDHGFVIPERRYNILNAYFLPDQDYDELLYSTISPVNTFRIIFNQYFNENFEILDDLMIDADIGGPYRHGKKKPFPESCP